jgi:hypothetical protein
LPCVIETQLFRRVYKNWPLLGQAPSHRKIYAAKVLKVLPAKKAARYVQIENEFRVLLKYHLAATVPLVQ